MSDSSVLSVVNVTKTFGWRRKTCVVDSISFEVKRGEIVALLGPNGAGKTTTAKMAAGLIIPDCGSLRVNGKDPHTEPDVLRNVGTVLEGNRNLFWRLTAAENLMYFAVLKKKKFKTLRKRVDEVLELFDLKDKKHVQVRNLSRGMQQRLAIAKCWLHSPSLVILDEPALGLDLYARNDLLDRITDLKAEGVSIIVTTHNFEIAQRISDRVMIMDKGRIVREGGTAILLDEFSSKKYVVELTEKPSDEQVNRLMAKFDIEFEGETLVFNESTTKLHEIIPEFKPGSIQSMKRKRTDLSDIFQQLTRRNKW